jgi:FecR protein
MRLLGLKSLGGFFLAAILSVPAWGANAPQPGTVNYFEGQAHIGNSTLTSNSTGKLRLKEGESLTTQNGKAEILLTPGVFLRVGADSSVKMISPDLGNTKVRLTNGHAMVEVDEIYKANDIRVLQDGASVRLLKKGLYDFDARQNQVRVFKGQALVREGDRHVKVGGDHQVALNATGNLKSRKFDKKAYEASLYRFSKLRSDYLAEANTHAARVYVANGWYGPGWGWGGWHGPGWFWDTSLNCFTFMPPAGVFYSPFGYPFYSPGVIIAHPHGFGPRFGDFHDFDGHPAFASRGPVVSHPDGDHDRDDVGGLARGPMMGGLHEGPAMGGIHAPGRFAR